MLGLRYRKRIVKLVAPLIAAIALPIVAGASPSPYVLVHLGPAGMVSAAYAASDGAQGGYIMYLDDAGYMRRHAVVWYGTAESMVDLHPAGWCETYVEAIGGGKFAGTGVATSDSSAPWHALAWSGTPAVCTDVHPAWAFGSCVKGAAPGELAGYTYDSGSAWNPRAQLWVGDAAPIDLTPAGANESYGYDTSGGQQVGYVGINGEMHAALWTGSASSFVDMHPAGYLASSICATDGASQVGYVGVTGANHACLWQGTPSSAIDLHPSGPFTFSYGMGVCGSVQVGVALDASLKWYALAWNGSAASGTALYDLLPVGWRNSWAEAVDAYGNIAGYYEDPTVQRAVAWMPERPASTVSSPNVAGGGGQQVTLTARLTAAGGGTPLAGRTIHFIVDHQELGTASTDAQGVASLACTLSYIPGTRSLACAFAGDDSYTPSCSVSGVTTLVTTGVWVVPVSGAPGDTITLQGVLMDVYGNRLIGKTLHFSVGGSEVGTGVTAAYGYATCPFTIPPGWTGTRTITVAFTDTGDPSYLTSSGTGTLTISTNQATTIYVPPASGAVGDTIKLQGCLYTMASGSMLKLVGKTLTFKVGGVTVGTGVTDVYGYAWCSYPITAGTPGSTLPFSVQFAGGGGYAASTGSGAITILATRATALYIPAASGAVGDTIKLQGCLYGVNGRDKLSGQTLVFKVGGVTVGTGVTDVYGYGSCAYTITSGTPGGTVGFTVEFAGSSGLDPCSGSSTITILALRRTSIYVVPVTAAGGSSATLQACLYATYGGDRLIGKVLHFGLGGVPVGDATTAAWGYATLPITVPAGTGPLAIDVTYDGDGTTFSGATGHGTLTRP